MWQIRAAGHNVEMVVVGIGGNDFNFGSIVHFCLTDFLTSPSWFPNYCHDDSSVTANLTTANVSSVKAIVAGAAERAQFGAHAGYRDTAFRRLPRCRR
jgi:hypothetical protein